MTDHPRAATHQPIPGSHQVFANDVVVSNTTVPHVPSLTTGTTTDEEGSIKCICNYLEDDGYTILCESCNTWQHADCYYEPENVPGEDESHSCVDCDPRPLDARRANEIQSGKLEDINTGDRKNKRTVKSHKKKVKPIDSLGPWSEKHELASPRNGLPKESKKPKATHRHSTSVHVASATAPKLVSRRSASHTVQSPSKGGDGAELTGEPYSEEFMHLYDNDPGESTMKANLLNDINVTSRLALWSDDVDELANATNGKTHPEVFLRTELLEAISRPQLQKHIKEDTAREFHTRHPKWVYLTTESSLARESFVGELVGKIGLMTDYVRDPANRWEYLRHPLPFVFFHPILPIYIDTRNEGSLLRYLRRSCQPNLTLKTFLENGSDYKFGFVAKENIEAGMELTIPWTTDEHVRAYTDENYILSYFTKVFADFGGCACESPEECAINKLARRLRTLPSDFSTSNGKKRGRKPKDQTLPRTNASRSGSEAVRYKEEDDDDDEHSTSTSSRSKPHSRDMTPQDSKPPGVSDELSEREKRKLAAAVERLDQDKNQPAQKKKKRISGTSNNTHITVNTSSSVPTFSDRPQTDFTPSKPSPVAPGVVRRHSGSPTNKTTFSIPELPRKSLPTVRSPARPPPNYVHSAMQTDPDPDDWMAPPATEQPKRKFLSLKKQLLMKAHQEKAIADERRKSEPSTPNGLTIGKSEEAAQVAPRKDADGDIAMENATSASVSPLSGSTTAMEKPRPPDSPSLDAPKILQDPAQPFHPPPVPLNTTVTAPVVNGFRNADLKIPLPPVLMTNGISPTPTTTAQSPIVQSPSVLATPTPGSLVSPSPIKKKLSLGDYMMRKGSTLSKPETSTNALLKEKDADSEGSPTSVVPPPTIDEAGEKVAEQSSITKTPTPQPFDDVTAPPALDTMEVDATS